MAIDERRQQTAQYAKLFHFVFFEITVKIDIFLRKLQKEIAYWQTKGPFCVPCVVAGCPGKLCSKGHPDVVYGPGHDNYVVDVCVDHNHL